MSRRVAIALGGKKGEGEIVERLKAALWKAGFESQTDDLEGAELCVVVGGDGTFLRTLERYGFPGIPFAGVNTGHLGFFQELSAGDIEEFVEKYANGDYVDQVYRTVSAEIFHGGGKISAMGLNEVALRGTGSGLAHLDIYIGDQFIERFSGDGVVVSTPAGSTAYNYALGGGIVDPRLDLLQLTPIAAVNNAAYRSFTSGILLPPDLSVTVESDPDSLQEVVVLIDGAVHHCKKLQRVKIALSNRNVTLFRFKNYEFWNTVKRKLLTP